MLHLFWFILTLPLLSFLLLLLLLFSSSSYQCACWSRHSFGSRYGHWHFGLEPLCGENRNCSRSYAFDKHAEKKKKGQERCLQSLTITHSLFFTCSLYVQITSLRRASGKFPSSYVWSFFGITKMVSNLRFPSFSFLSVFQVWTIIMLHLLLIVGVDCRCWLLLCSSPRLSHFSIDIWRRHLAVETSRAQPGGGRGGTSRIDPVIA
jgi:hypothetical protein